MRPLRISMIATTIFLALWSGDALLARAQDDRKAVVVGAVLDFSKTPTGAIFEAKLLASAKLKWVERAEVDKILAEQKLQAIFSPDGVGKRAGLAKLLKADFLVMIRAGVGEERNPKKTLEIVVCESQRGLRLANQSVAVTDNAEADVAGMESIVGDALEALSNKITDICAVPPFICNDLDFKHEHLKSAYSRIVEQRLLRHKGVLLVELAEAQSIAKEAILSGAAAKIEQRQLPLYFLGSFRNDETDGKQFVALELKLHRGDTAIGSKALERIAADEVPKQLSQLAAEFTDKILLSGATGTFEPDAEVKQLVGRAAHYEKLGNWHESLSMLEAALLVSPGQAELHQRASRAAALQCIRVASNIFFDPPAAERALVLHSRALVHMENAVRPTQTYDPPTSPETDKRIAPMPCPEVEQSGHRVQGLVNLKPYDLERHKLWNKVRKQEQDTYLRLCRVRARAGYGDEQFYLARTLELMWGKSKAECAYAMIQELKDLPLAKERTIAFARKAYQGPSDPEYIFILDKLADDPHPAIKAAADTLKKEGADRLARLRNASVVPTLPKREGDSELRFQEVDFKFEKPPVRYRAGFQLEGCLPIGADLDLMIIDNTAYLMREKGTLRELWRGDGAVRNYCYDGRYVWFSASKQDHPARLFVVDPNDMKVVEFTPDDGLPRIDPKSLPERRAHQQIALAPMSPGRICAIGSFGRTWLGVATYDPAAGEARRRSVKIFHEAREVPKSDDDPLLKTSTTFAFDPHTVKTLTTEKGKRIFVGRQHRLNSDALPPLLIDPETLAMEVVPNGPSWSRLYSADFRDGSIFYSIYTGKIYGPAANLIGSNIVQRDLTTGKITDTGATGFPQSKVLIRKDQYFVITFDAGWWYATAAQKQAQFLGFIPGGRTQHVTASNHYGLLTSVQQIGSEPRKVPPTYKIYQIEVVPRKADANAADRKSEPAPAAKGQKSKDVRCSLDLKQSDAPNVDRKFASGDPIVVRCHVEYLGNREAEVTTMNHPLRTFVFDVKGPNGQPVPMTQFAKHGLDGTARGLNMSVKMLKPGERITTELNLNRYFDMTVPGIYRISFLQSVRPVGEFSAAHESNVLTITVEEPK